MLNVILPELISKFVRAGIDYDDAFKELGLKGQFSDIWRKVAKLKRAIWDGQKLQREQPREILGDLFGHILIAIYLIDQEQSET